MWVIAIISGELSRQQDGIELIVNDKNLRRPQFQARVLFHGTFGQWTHVMFEKARYKDRLHRATLP